MCEACPVIDWAELLPSLRSLTPSSVTDDDGEHVVWYDRYDPADKALVGGKNASLGEMMHAGLPVPPGFAVTVGAYAQIWSDSGLAADVNGLLASIDHDDLAGNMTIATAIRQRIEQAPIPPDVAAEVAEAYDALSAHCGAADLPVAVRSSATAEDLPDASFAGQQDTYLWVRGGADVLERMRQCWSSLFTDRAIAYRHAMGHTHHAIAMSVGIQKMVDPVASGVAFTLNPNNGDRSQVAIDASWGLGEAVVAGEVTPDNFLVDKVIHEIVSRTVSDKQIEYRVGDSGSVVRAEVPEERRSVQCVSDDELRAIARLARRAEQHYGSPQDVEWAIDAHLPEAENIVMLQSRPETVWSRKAAAPLSRSTSQGMSSIVSTLLSPMHAAKRADADHETQ